MLGYSSNGSIILLIRDYYPNVSEHNPPTLRYRRTTDRQTTCDSNTAIRTCVLRAVKQDIYTNIISIWIWNNTVRLYGQDFTDIGQSDTPRTWTTASSAFNRHWFLL